MKTVDINKIKNIKKELESLEKDEVLFVNEDGSSKYVCMPMELYETVEDFINVDEEELLKNTQIKVINANDIELTYDEYEKVKEQIIDALDRTFKPKPEKLN